MSAGSVGFRIEQGATFEQSFQFSDADDQPVDLTGAIVRLQARTAYGGTLLLECTLENGQLVVDSPASGIVRWTLTAEETAALKFSTGVYDMEIEFADGTVRRVLSGLVGLSQEATTEEAA